MLYRKCFMQTQMNGLSKMEEYVLVTRLAVNPDRALFYNGTANNSDTSFALNSIVAFDISDAMVFEFEQATKLCRCLNSERGTLLTKGYLEFEVIKK